MLRWPGNTKRPLAKAGDGRSYPAPLTRRPEYSLSSSKLFGNPAIHRLRAGDGPVALRHRITPVLPLSEKTSGRFSGLVSSHGNASLSSGQSLQILAEMGMLPKSCVELEPGRVASLRDAGRARQACARLTPAGRTKKTCFYATLCQKNLSFWVLIREFPQLRRYPGPASPCWCRSKTLTTAFCYRSRCRLAQQVEARKIVPQYQIT